MLLHCCLLKMQALYKHKEVEEEVGRYGFIIENNNYKGQILFYTIK